MTITKNPGARSAGAPGICSTDTPKTPKIAPTAAATNGQGPLLGGFPDDPRSPPVAAIRARRLQRRYGLTPAIARAVVMLASAGLPQ